MDAVLNWDKVLMAFAAALALASAPWPPPGSSRGSAPRVPARLPRSPS